MTKKKPANADSHKPDKASQERILFHTYNLTLQEVEVKLS